MKLPTQHEMLEAATKAAGCDCPQGRTHDKSNNFLERRNRIFSSLKSAADILALYIESE